MTSDRVLWTSRRSVMSVPLLYGAQSRYVQVTRWAHEYNDFRLKMAATGLPSSWENTPIDLPRARRRDPRYVIALIDPVSYYRQTVLAETADAVVGVAKRKRHLAVGAAATHRLVPGQGAERYALVLGLRERATVMRGALLRQRDRLALPQVRAGPSFLVVTAPHASRIGRTSAVRLILKVLASPRGVPALGLDGVPLTESRRYAQWPGVGRLARGRPPRVAHVVGLVPVALCRDPASLGRRQSPALHLTLPAPVLAPVRGVAHGGVGHPRAPVPSSHRVFPSLDSP